MAPTGQPDALAGMTTKIHLCQSDKAMTGVFL
jgi:hypothetical protein